MSADSTHKRPDPDALLAEVQAGTARASRGKLKIFFGMSAGVGKTYAMLEEARKRATEGVDVVVGYAEPHIRPDTEAILVALDILPYRLVEYRGANLKEFDLDAALARKPAICCVDELAHTNAPGMRHPKRWQDVAELLNAGINVYTTLNVQHLESVNDLVERITGVRVRETLPDAVFDGADEVELVDIAPVELLERFREGRIYKPEQAERASRHFFTKGNLIALREMALRKTAERVDEQMQQYRRSERIHQVVPASEKVLVCVGPSPLSARVVRSARRLAHGLRSKLVAVTVEAERNDPQATIPQAQIDANLALADELGALTVRLQGRNVATEVLAYATTHNVTKIVVGKPARPRWKEILFGSVVDDLIRGSGEIDIYVIRGDEAAESRPPRIASPLKKQFDWWGMSCAVGVVAATTLIGWPLYHRYEVANENVLMLYLLGVTWVAARYSRAATIVAAILSVAAFDIAFVEPIYRFTVHDRQYIVTFLVMLITALVISVLTHRVRSQAESSRQRERRTAAVLQLSRDLALARTATAVAAATVRHVQDAIGGRAALLLPESNEGMRLAADSVSEESQTMPEPREVGVAHWAAQHAEPAGCGTGTLPASAGRYIPLMDGANAVAVLAIYPPVGQEGWSTDQRDLADAMSLQAAVAMGRVLANDEARAAWERVESESLRNTLLSGVSHELRTPLAGITGAATMLAERGETITNDARHEMLETLVDEASRMERLINNLLDMTRMEAGGLLLKKEWTPIDEVIGAALHHLDGRLKGRKVTTRIAPNLPLVNLDAGAIEQVIANFLDNAIEYTPAGSAIELTVDGDAKQIGVEVADHGPGLPAGMEKRVFDKFFRAKVGDGASRRGVGLGLAICKGIVEAHGGTIRAANRSGGGASFVFSLPIGGTPPVVEYDGRDES